MPSPAVLIPLLKLNRLSFPDELTPPVQDLHAVIIASGRDGRNGDPGEDGGRGGNHGSSGQPGEHGEHAHPISASLQVDHVGRVQLLHHPSPTTSRPFTLPLSNPLTSIFLCARGGHGGHGGPGGSGGRGSAGSDGRDASRNSSATNGGPGGPGGDSGDGGAGGSAGNGASITLAISPDDTDLLLLLKSPPPTHGGTSGQGAEGGKGGPGGPGGKGGEEYTYTTHHDDRSETITRPAGHDGAHGIRGCDGAQGRDGVAGAGGDFTIYAGTLGTFRWRYDINLCDDLVVRDWLSSSVIEPGTRCSIHYSVHNCGGMPTPRSQDIFLSAERTSWIYPVAPAGDSSRVEARPGTTQEHEQDIRGAVLLPRNIQPDTISASSEPFYVGIADVITPTAGAPLVLHTRVFHRATLTRVNQDFPLVSDLATKVKISYPLEITPAVGHVCVLPGHESVIAWKVRNVSTQAIGAGAPISRCASTRLHLRRDEGVDARDARGNSLREVEAAMGYKSSLVCNDELVSFGKRDESSESFVFTPAHPPPPPIEVTLLRPGEEFLVKKVLRVSAGAPAEEARAEDRESTGQERAVGAPSDHSVVYLNTHLDLAHPLRRQILGEIQVRPFQVQIACPFKYEPSVSQSLLVVNDRTTASELSQWRALLSGTSSDKVSVWNHSLYGGFSFRYKGDMDKCLGELFSGELRNILFLNNMCTPGGVRTGGKEEFPLKHLGCEALFDAAKSLGCQVYAFGSHSGLNPTASLGTYVENMEMWEAENEIALKEWAPSILFPSIWNGASRESEAKKKTPLQQAQNAAANADIKGFLYKKKQRGSGKLMRYFVVRKAQGILSYYMNVASKTAKATYPLSKCEMVESVGDIRVQTPQRLLVLTSAGSKPSLKRWKEYLEQAIRYAKLPDSEKEKQKNPDFYEEYPAGAKVCCSTKVVKMTGTGKNEIKLRAEKVAKELASMYPETPFMTVYRNIKPEERERAAGLFKASSAVGEIFVYGGVKLHAGRIVMNVMHREVGNDTTLGDVNMYGYLKSLSFGRKLEILRNSASDGRLPGGSRNDENLQGLRALVDSVLSDVADEVALFSYGNEKMGTMLRNMGGRAGATQEWLARMKFVSGLYKENVLGVLDFPSVKFDECFRLAVILKILCNVLAPVKMGNVGRRGIVAQAVMGAVKQVQVALATASGHDGKVQKLSNSETFTFAGLEKKWSKDGVKLGAETVKAKNLLERLRKRDGLFQGNGKMEDGGHMPSVMSWAEHEGLYKCTVDNGKFPNIRKQPGAMDSDAERVEAMEELVRRYTAVKRMWSQFACETVQKNNYPTDIDIQLGSQ